MTPQARDRAGRFAARSTPFRSFLPCLSLLPRLPLLTLLTERSGAGGVPPLSIRGLLHSVPLDYAVSSFTAAASAPHAPHGALWSGSFLTNGTLRQDRFRGSRGDFFAKVPAGSHSAECETPKGLGGEDTKLYYFLHSSLRCCDRNLPER